MSLVDRILGRKETHTAATLAREIEARTAALVEAKNRLASARQRRQDAKNNLDAAAMTDADIDAVRVGNEIEVLEHALQELESAHAAQVEAEELAAFRSEVAAHEKAAGAIRKEIEAKYPVLVAPLRDLLARLEAHRAAAVRLNARARDLGEAFQPASVESFRDAAPTYRVTWPNGGGGVTISSPEGAPSGSIRWIGGEPVSTRDDVMIEARPIVRAESLMSAVRLPGLLAKDSDFWPPAAPTLEVPQSRESRFVNPHAYLADRKEGRMDDRAR